MQMNESVVNQFFYLTGEDQDPMTIYVFDYDEQEKTISVLTDWEMEIYILSEEAFEDFIPADEAQTKSLLENVYSDYERSLVMANTLKEPGAGFSSEDMEAIKAQADILVEWQNGAKVLLKNHPKA